MVTGADINMQSTGLRSGPKVQPTFDFGHVAVYSARPGEHRHAVITPPTKRRVGLPELGKVREEAIELCAPTETPSRELHTQVNPHILGAHEVPIAEHEAWRCSSAQARNLCKNRRLVSVESDRSKCTAMMLKASLVACTKRTELARHDQPGVLKLREALNDGRADTNHDPAGGRSEVARAPTRVQSSE